MTPYEMGKRAVKESGAVRSILSPAAKGGLVGAGAGGLAGLGLGRLTTATAPPGMDRPWSLPLILGLIGAIKGGVVGTGLGGAYGVGRVTERETREDEGASRPQREE